MRTSTRATATITSKGQLTLPKQVRERLGVDKGDEVEFTLDDQGIHLRPRLRNHNPFLAWLDRTPTTTAFPPDLLDARHTGLDDTERTLLQTGPGATIIRFADLDEEPAS